MPLISKFIGLALVLFVVIFTCGPGYLGSFYDFNALVLVLGITLGGVLLIHGFTGIKSVISDSIVRKNDLSEGRLNSNVALLSQAAFFANSAGALSGLMGFVKMLTNLRSPADLGPAMATALLGILYGLLISSLIFVPIRASLLKKYQPSNPDNLGNNMYGRIQAYSWFGFMSLMMIFWVLLARPDTLVVTPN
jgi:flagellar motor component MotA